MSDGGGVNWQTEVLDSTYDKATSYAILSHRWTEQEVNYEEIVDLAKMGKKDQIRQRLGYQKILASCVQAKKDKFEQLWVDMCCIDKRSSAELSEAINSMYQWYENAGVCYVYLHDIPNPWFPTACDKERYHDFRGWPEWFSHGWTLQELIAPSGVQFFSKNWQNIGNKRMLAPTLAGITGIPGLWKAGHLRSGILSAEWRLAVVRCANPFLDRSFSKGHLTPPSFITLSYSRMSRPSYSRKSRHPYITPSYSGKSRHPYITPSYSRKSRRLYITPLYSGKSRRPYITPSYSRNSRHPYLTLSYSRASLHHVVMQLKLTPSCNRNSHRCAVVYLTIVQ